MEVCRVTAMANDAWTVDVGLVEAQQRSIERGVGAHGAGLHQLLCRRAEDLRGTLPEVGEHELRHIGGRGAQGPGRSCRVYVLEWLALELAIFKFITPG